MEGVGGGTEAEAGDRWQVGGEVEGGHGHLLRRRSLAPKKMLCSHPIRPPKKKEQVSHQDSCPEMVRRRPVCLRLRVVCATRSCPH